jgi:hypothetical protein
MNTLRQQSSITKNTIGKKKFFLSRMFKKNKIKQKEKIQDPPPQKLTYEELRRSHITSLAKAYQ